MPPRSKLLPSVRLFLAFLACTIVPCTHAETFRNPQRIPLPVDPYGVATGDLNGDGRNDIVWTELPGYPGTAVLHVLLAAANGQYTSAPDLSLPFPPTSIQCTVEDVTGDKRNDVVCVGASSNGIDVFLLTYPGNGDGTFGSPVETDITAQPTFGNPILARAGDLNGDGLPDVLVMNANNSGFLSYLSDGKGGFKFAGLFQGSFNYSVPVVTDLNGDGKLDVLWPTGPRVDLGNGDGTFSAITQYDPGFDSYCAFGDVDHDGHLDAVCTWYNEFSTGDDIYLGVLHGNADGSFDETPIFTRGFGDGKSEEAGIPDILMPVLVADLNGDGYADIVSLSGDGYCVLLGGPNTTWNGQPQQFVAASDQSQEGLQGIYGVSIADMNGDGVLDIVAIGPNGLYITYAQPDGTLSSASAPEVGQVSTSATLVDVNGDGNLDVVSAGDTALKLSLGHGDGTFSSPIAITTTGNFALANYVSPSIISGDFNGDGKQDLIATGSTGAYTSQNYILFGHGNGTFSAPQPISNSIQLGTVADLNGDGRSDIISIPNSAPTNSLVASISLGDGTFTTASTNMPVETPVNGINYLSDELALADFRHSGRLDVAVALYDNAYTLPSNGDGTFNSTGAVLAIPGLPNLNKVGSVNIAAGDFDGDGNSDIAVLVLYGTGTYNYTTPTSAAWVFYGNGDGTFSSAVLAGTFNRDAQTISAGDLSGDGMADLVLTSYAVYQDNGVLIVHALPNRTWGPEVNYTGGEGLSPLWITDINHDGHNDLIFSNALRDNYAANSISVLINQPGNTVTGNLTASPEPSKVTYPFTLNAVLSPASPTDTFSGNVIFSLDGTVVGSASLSGNTASLNLSGTSVAAGSHALSASWPGNSTYPALTFKGTHKVSILPLTISLTATPSSLSIGGTVTATATFTPGVAPNLSGYQFTGIMTLDDNGVPIAQQQVSTGGFSFTIPSLTPGIHSLSVSYPGDAIFAAAQSNSATVTVAGVTSVATLTVSPVASTYGTTVTFIANISALAVSSGLHVPTGFVIFTVDGTPLRPVVVMNAVASTIQSNLLVGPHPVSCTYSGDAIYAPSACNTVPLTVGQEAQTITFPMPSPGGPGSGGVTLTATATSGLPVSYTLVSGPATLSGNFLTFTGQGLIVVAANQAGNVNFSAAPTVKQSIAVLPPPVSVVLAASPNPVFVQNPVKLTAALSVGNGTNGTPTGTVTFKDGTTPLGTTSLSGGGATLTISTLALGFHSLTATYNGNSQFDTTTSLAVIELVEDFSLSSTNPNETISHGGLATYSLLLAPLSGAVTAAPISFAVSGQPEGSEISFSPTSIAVSSAATPVTLTIRTPNYPVGPWNSLRVQSHSRISLAFVTLGLCLLLCTKRRRTLRLQMKRLSCIVLLIAGVIASAYITGCGSGWKTQKYTITVTAASENLVRTATLSLTTQCSDGKTECPIAQ